MHHITVDVEEYFQVSAFAPHVPRSTWRSLPSRLRPQMDRLLGLMADHDVRGTFFVLGWVAERHPEIVQELVREGHEVASHGWDHRRVTALTPAEFRWQVRHSKRMLEDIGGEPVQGYRAPSFSIVRGREWALDVLLEEGYAYDSSLYPVRRPGYGYPGGRTDVHDLATGAGTLAEVPPSVLRLWGVNLPAGGGGALRLLPAGFVTTALRRLEREGRSGTVYLHPWELDPDQPRIAGPGWVTRLRHYGGLSGTEGRLRRLLGEFSFGPIRDTLARRESPGAGHRARTAERPGGPSRRRTAAHRVVERTAP